MATPSGFDSQIGYAAEGTLGTYQAPTRTIEHVKETLKYHKERIESAGIKAGRRFGSGLWQAGREWVDGTITHELSAANIGLLLKHHFGAVATTGSDPYEHEFTAGSGVEAGLTIQVGRPDLAGTVQPFSYLGCHIPKIKISSEIGKNAMLEMDVYGQYEDTGQSLASTAYPSDWAPFCFLHGVLTIGGSEYEFDKFSFESANGLMTGRHTHRTTTPGRPRGGKESGLRTAGGQIDGEFISLTAYNRFRNGTEAALVLTFDAGSSAQLEISGNVRFDGDTPNVDGPQMLKQMLPFKFLSTTDDDTALTVTLTNGDSTP